MQETKSAAETIITARSKTAARLSAQLAEVGATLDDTGYDLHCDAPLGYVWEANAMVGFTIHYANNCQSWLLKAIALEMPALKMGLRLATKEEQDEICWNNDCESWVAPEGAPEKIAFPKFTHIIRHGELISTLN